MRTGVASITDRSLHHAHVVATTGKKYRVKDAPAGTEEAQKTAAKRTCDRRGRGPRPAAGRPARSNPQ